MSLSIAAERCKSCQYCVDSCPKKALYVSEKTNKMGYKVVDVDQEKCIQCGTCYTVCPDWVFEIN
jgi:2-oxoglutarate ferredoxin oxidoreductase subunit delta